MAITRPSGSVRSTARIVRLFFEPMTVGTRLPPASERGVAKRGARGRQGEDRLCLHWPPVLRPSVIANGRVVRLQRSDVLNLLGADLAVGCGLGLPQDLFPDCEVALLLPGKVCLDDGTLCAAIVV